MVVKSKVSLLLQKSNNQTVDKSYQSCKGRRKAPLGPQVLTFPTKDLLSSFIIHALFECSYRLL